MDGQTKWDRCGTVGCAWSLLKYRNNTALLEFASVFHGTQDTDMRTKDLNLALNAYTSSQLLLLFVDCMWLHQVFVDWVTNCTWCTRSSWPSERNSARCQASQVSKVCAVAQPGAIWCNPDCAGAQNEPTAKLTCEIHLKFHQYTILPYYCSLRLVIVKHPVIDITCIIHEYLPSFIHLSQVLQLKFLDASWTKQDVWEHPQNYTPPVGEKSIRARFSRWFWPWG